MEASSEFDNAGEEFVCFIDCAGARTNERQRCLGLYLVPLLALTSLDSGGRPQFIELRKSPKLPGNCRSASSKESLHLTEPGCGSATNTVDCVTPTTRGVLQRSSRWRDEGHSKMRECYGILASLARRAADAAVRVAMRIPQLANTQRSRVAVGGRRGEVAGSCALSIVCSTRPLSSSRQR